MTTRVNPFASLPPLPPVHSFSASRGVLPLPEPGEAGPAYPFFLNALTLPNARENSSVEGDNSLGFLSDYFDDLSDKDVFSESAVLASSFDPWVLPETASERLLSPDLADEGQEISQPPIPLKLKLPKSSAAGKQPVKRKGSDSTWGKVSHAGKTSIRNLTNETEKLSDKKASTNHKFKNRFKCEQCNYSAKWKAHLNEHMRIHTGEKPFSCLRCDYRATTKGALTRHLRVHTGDRSFKCDQCDYRATQKGNLNVHMRTHTGEKPYKCNECDYRAAQRGDLSRHLRVHARERPFRCDQCDYRAATKSTLTRHSRVHTGERPFECTECDYAATQKGSLNTHMRIHTGERPYKCDLCEFAATQKGSLNTHMRIHTGERPYKCDLCDYSAATKTTLKRHSRVHTREKL